MSNEKDLCLPCDPPELPVEPEADSLCPCPVEPEPKECKYIPRGQLFDVYEEYVDMMFNKKVCPTYHHIPFLPDIHIVKKEEKEPDSLCTPCGGDNG